MTHSEKASRRRQIIASAKAGKSVGALASTYGLTCSHVQAIVRSAGEGPMARLRISRVKMLREAMEGASVAELSVRYHLAPGTVAYYLSAAGTPATRNYAGKDRVYRVIGLLLRATSERGAARIVGISRQAVSQIATKCRNHGILPRSQAGEQEVA